MKTLIGQVCGWFRRLRRQRNIFASMDFETEEYRLTIFRRMQFRRLRRKCRKIVRESPVDDLCGGIFDSAIETAVGGAKNEAEYQYVRNVQDILDNKTRMRGELVFAKQCLDDLEKDLEMLDARREEVKKRIEYRKGYGV